jgi:hypothetical protein
MIFRCFIASSSSTLHCHSTEFPQDAQKHAVARFRTARCRRWRVGCDHLCLFGFSVHWLRKKRWRGQRELRRRGTAPEVLHATLPVSESFPAASGRPSVCQEAPCTVLLVFRLTRTVRCTSGSITTLPPGMPAHNSCQHLTRRHITSCAIWFPYTTVLNYCDTTDLRDFRFFSYKLCISTCTISDSSRSRK